MNYFVTEVIDTFFVIFGAYCVFIRVALNFCMKYVSVSRDILGVYGGARCIAVS